jgi:hypothetical protein
MRMPFEITSPNLSKLTCSRTCCFFVSVTAWWIFPTAETMPWNWPRVRGQPEKSMHVLSSRNHSPFFVQQCTTESDGTAEAIVAGTADPTDSNPGSFVSDRSPSINITAGPLPRSQSRFVARIDKQDI